MWNHKLRWELESTNLHLVYTQLQMLSFEYKNGTETWATTNRQWQKQSCVQVWVTSVGADPCIFCSSKYKNRSSLWSYSPTGDLTRSLLSLQKTPSASADPAQASAGAAHPQVPKDRARPSYATPSGHPKEHTWRKATHHHAPAPTRVHTKLRTRFREEGGRGRCALFNPEPFLSQDRSLHAWRHHAAGREMPFMLLAWA